MAKTKQYTRFISKQELQATVEKCALQFIQALEHEMISSYDLLPVGISDRHDYINYVAHKNNWPDYVRKLYLQCFYTSELRSKGSGNISTCLLSGLLLGHQASVETDDIIRVKTPEAFNAIEAFVGSQSIELIKRSLTFIGVNGKFAIKKTESSVPTLELRSNHRFLVGLDDRFLFSSIKKDEAKILVYDGQIQDIGQVDRLFSECHEQNASCVIIARSFSDDVISTINANHRRNTLDIIPIKVNDEITNFNIMSDIAVCSNAFFIHAESGVRISNVSINDISTITGVSVDGMAISFDKKEESDRAVERRICKINEKINKSMFQDGLTKEDVDLIYGQRLDSLSSNIAVLWVNGDKQFIQYLNNLFLFSITTMASFANTGGIVLELFDGKKYLIPAEFADTAISVAKTLKESIRSSGGCVELR